MHALTGNKNKGYNVAAWNCRRGLLTADGSPSSKVADIQLYMEKHQLDVFGIIESDLHGTQSRIYRARPLSTQDVHDKLHIDDYYIHLPQSWEAHGQARIFLYVKEGIILKERKLNREDLDLPSLSIELGLGREKKTCFNFFYREFTGGVSGLNDLPSQRERLGRQIAHWKTLYTNRKDVVILGDCNLCCKLWQNENYHSKEQSSLVQDFLLEESSQQLVTEMTRVELVGGTVQRSCIDHCYSDVLDKIKGPFVESVGDSDHLGVRILKYSKSPASRPQVIRRRVYKNFKAEAFLTDIYFSNINTSVLTHQNLKSASEAFRNEFCAILDLHAPVRTVQMRKKYCPYLTEERKFEIADRNALQKEASKTGDIVLMKEYKNKAKLVKKGVENDKKQGRLKELSDTVNSREAWQAARKILGLRKNDAPTAIKDEVEGLITNPAKIATTFNNFFVEKVRALRAKTASPPTINPVERLENWLKKREEPPAKFKIREITRKELRTLIKKMKGGKSCGIDNIDNFSLKLAAPLIEDALLHLVNLSIRTSCFSSLWKHQLIFPHHKKQDKLLTKNYRPVSHLVEIGQLVEQAVSFQVVGHFTSNRLFHRNHHGGLANLSTSTALIQVYDMILKAAENKRLTAALLLDQSSAYDLLDHSILLKKLACYGFHEDSIQWFNSYLSGRTQSVQVEAQQSTTIELGDFAAPQGSVLGGLLFIINENDFPDCRTEGESVLFVDDDSDLVDDDIPEHLLIKIQHEANLSCNWLKDNRMCVAGDKSKLLIIGTKELKRSKLGDQVHSIVVDGKTVSETKSEKLLGVIFNNTMTWKEHLHGEDWRDMDNNQGLIPQLSQRLGILKRLSQYSSKKKLKMLAAGLFYSKLAYCLPLFTTTWGLDQYREGQAKFTSYTKKDNRQLQVLQNQVFRLILPSSELAGSRYRKQNLSTEELLKRTDELSVHQLGAMSTIIMTKKILQSGKPEFIADQMIVREAGGTRSGNTMQLARSSLTLSREGFLYRGSKLFNLLPENLRNENKISKFKREAKAWVKLNIAVKP